MSSRPSKATAVMSGTSGAVPVRNEKGEISMQKVKVDRYVAGKRPKYAPESDDEENESAAEEEKEEESEEELTRPSSKVVVPLKTDVNDRRLRRLQDVERASQSGDILEEARRRHVAEPEVLEEGDDMDIESDEESGKRQPKPDSDDDETIDEEERMRRRAELRKRALQRQDELMARQQEDEKKTGGGGGGASSSRQREMGSEDEDNDDDESEYDDDDDDDEDEYEDDDEDAAPRLKPVFIRKNDRVTIQEKELEKKREKEIEIERDRLHQENKKHTRKIIQDEITREKLAEKETDDNIVCDFKTDDDEFDEKEYEEWKLRELKRIKRDREDKENQEKEKQEIQKIRNMTEEERTAYFKQNPKLITNQNVKGRYKFLQKYYHRGAFFMDQDDQVFKRDFAQPTLEDKFDKTILPKVMQVKNFGMAGRTKYTHLVDQDTSARAIEENPWLGQEKFIAGRGGGTKQVFDKPTAKKRK